MQDVKIIHELVRDMEQDLTGGKVTISKYVDWSLFDNNNRIDAYLNSKHISGDIDAQGREKPFFNISTAVVNIWHRATDIDRKNIRIKATKQADYILSFLVNILFSEWMRKQKFGQFLNEWGRSLARYGSIPLKFIERAGELHAEVIPWNRMVCDQIDFENNPKIEKLWLTPAQLRKNKLYDQDYVEQIIERVSLKRDTLDKDKHDNKDGYIPLYEVHGELPLSHLTDKETDDDTYVQQMHVVCFEANNEDADIEYADYTLYKGKESKDPYLLTHLIKEDGRVQGIGAVEHLFEAQWMVNHSTKLIKDQLDLASKLIYQTSDGNFVGQNMLKAIENGQILIHQVNQPLTQVNNGSHDITALQSYATQWQVLSQEVSSTPDALRGNTMPSGTAFRQVAILNQEANSLFELMVENKGQYIEEMAREFIIPYLKKKMDTSEEISAILDENQIKQLDSKFVPNEAIRRANQKIIKNILSKSVEDLRNGSLITGEEQNNLISTETNALNEQLSQFGQQRFIKPSDIESKTWKEIIKDFEWDIMVDVTSEERDTQAIMQTLTSVLQTVAGLQGQPMPEDMQVVFNKILEETGGISPFEFKTKQQAPPAPQQQLPQQSITNQQA